MAIEQAAAEALHKVSSTTSSKAHQNENLILLEKLSKDHDVVLKTLRLLISDLCQQFNGGHPGYVLLVMGANTIGT